jgi:hypothetical protein
LKFSAAAKVERGILSNLLETLDLKRLDDHIFVDQIEMDDEKGIIIKLAVIKNCQGSLSIIFNALLSLIKSLDTFDITFFISSW